MHRLTVPMLLRANLPWRTVTDGDFMTASNRGGRPSAWVCNGARTHLLHRLIALALEIAKELGLKQPSEDVFERISADPSFRALALRNSVKSLKASHLQRRYNQGKELPPPPMTDQDRWISELQAWGEEPKTNPVGMSAERAGAMIARLLAIETPYRDQFDPLFVHMENRIHWNGRQKIEWIKSAIERLERDPFDWPIPKTRYGRPDVNQGLVLAVPTKGPQSKDDIVAATGLKPTTVQNLLVSLVRAKKIVRIGHARYALPAEGLSPHVETRKAIRDVLARGPKTFDEIRSLTNKTDSELHGALHKLKKDREVVLIGRGRHATYALTGTATPHVYAREAIKKALRSGPKTVPQLMEITEKNRGEIWAALRRLEANGEVKQTGTRGRFFVFSLTAKGRRQTPDRRQPHAHESSHAGL